MDLYDRGLDHHRRINFAGNAEVLKIIRELKPDEIELCDYLWSRGYFKILFQKLWSLKEIQIKHLCELFLRKVWNLSACEIQRFFEDEALTVCGCDLFDSLFDEKFQKVAGTTKRDYEFWIKIRNKLMIERSYLKAHDLEKGCVYLCSIIQQLATWGTSQRFDYNGLADLDSFEFSENISTQPKSENSQLKELDQLSEKSHQKWSAFKNKLKLIKKSHADSSLR